MPPIHRHGWQHTRVYDRSWLDRQDSGVAALTPGSEALQLCALGEYLIAQD